MEPLRQSVLMLQALQTETRQEIEQVQQQLQALGGSYDKAHEPSEAVYGVIEKLIADNAALHGVAQEMKTAIGKLHDADPRIILTRILNNPHDEWDLEVVLKFRHEQHAHQTYTKHLRKRTWLPHKQDQSFCMDVHETLTLSTHTQGWDTAADLINDGGIQAMLCPKADYYLASVYRAAGSILEETKCTLWIAPITT